MAKYQMHRTSLLSTQLLLWTSIITLGKKIDDEKTLLLKKFGFSNGQISSVDLSYVVKVKSTVEISQNFVAFSEYMNFTQELRMLVGGYLIAQAPGPNWLHSFFFEGGQINKQKYVT